MLWLSFDPQRKIKRILLIFIDINPCPSFQVLPIKKRHFTIILKLHSIKIHRSIDYITITFFNQNLDQINHFYNMPGCPRIYCSPLYIQIIHIPIIISDKQINQLHRLHFPLASPFFNLVFSCILIISKMSYISEILDMKNIITSESQITRKNIPVTISKSITHMKIIINSLTAGIDMYSFTSYWLKILHLPCHSVEKSYTHAHSPDNSYCFVESL